jgi:hypothetical protein
MWFLLLGEFEYTNNTEIDEIALKLQKKVSL